MPVTVICHNCGTEFKVKPKRVRRGVKYCSMDCRRGHQYTGKFVRSDGYVAVKVNGRFELEHRVIMAQYLNRPLRSDEHTHHRNGNKSDNRLENLEIVGVGEHISKYHPSQRQPDKWTTCQCLECGKSFQRIAVEVKNHPRTFCSRDCYVSGKRKGICP